jgi:dipeptidyl-peptidase-4
MKTIMRAALCGLALAAMPLVASATESSVSKTAALLAEAEPRIKEIYEKRAFAPATFRAQWLRDSSGYLVLESPDRNGQPELVQYDAAGGKRTVLISRKQLGAAAKSGVLTIREFVESPAARQFLIGANHVVDGREQYGYWMFDAGSSTLTPIKASIDAVNWVSAFDAKGERIVYQRGSNLHALELSSGRTTQLTTAGVPGKIEIGHIARWSPDGRRVAFVQSDFSKVRERSSVKADDPTYPSVTRRKFARVGTPIATHRVGVAAAQGGDVRWIDLPNEPGTFYVIDVRWAGNPDELLIELHSRFRDLRWFLIANLSTGKLSTLYQESDRAWVDSPVQVNGGLEPIHDGRDFILLSERDGWRHAYIISRDGQKQSLLTKDAADIIARGPVDEKNGWFYYIASPENATQRYLYRIRLDGSGSAERVTPADQPGTHSYEFSPDCKWAFHTYSNFDTPPVTDLVQLPEHRVVRTIEDNHVIRERLKTWITRPTEFLKLDIGGGVVMDAWMIKPRDFDPAKKYPVFVFVYGEPAGQTVLDDWRGGQNHTMYHRLIADLGYLVVSIDNRGTPAPKGAAWRRAVFPSLGPLSTEEQAAGLKVLGRQRSYVDLSRVGIWGWSGGGSNTLNALFRKPDVYHVGIAVAPKPQPQLYNAGFQETFMRTPEVNPEGYRQSAPINFAEGLRGDLLILHGTGETNTHVQITEGLVDRLIELGKQFDYMTYPNRDHSFHEGRGTEVHLRMHMIRYLVEHLPAGPR